MFEFISIFLIAALGTAVTILLRKLSAVRFEKEELERRNASAEPLPQPAGDPKEMTAIVESMIEGVLVIDENEHIVLANPACAAIFRASAAEMRERPFWEVLRHAEFSEMIKTSLKTGSFEHTEISVYLPEEKILNAQISPVRSETGKIQGAVCVLHDITSMKKLENLRKEFVANVSHELKTPLTSIKGFVETLLDGAVQERETAVKFLKIIEEQSNRLERLIGEVLELARLESEENILSSTRFDAAAFLENITRLYEKRASLKRQKLEVDISRSMGEITADEDKIERAVSNLLENAIKFTPEGGTIRVAGTEKNGAVLITVTDTGIGIPESDLPRIFERFYRVDPSRSSAEGGTGLGLAIVKHIAQAHGGQVSVESVHGKGSTFTISLPKEPHFKRS